MEILFRDVNSKWVSIVYQLTDHPDHFKNLVNEKEISVEALYDYLSPLCNHFLKVTTAEAEPLSGNTSIKEAVSMNRLLGKKSLEKLPPEVARELTQQLYNNFYFGLLGHLYFGNFPSRDKYHLLDLNQIGQEWEYKTILADVELRDYTNSNPFFKVIYEYNFENDYKPFLKENIGVGMFGIGKYKSFYRNIYFAGVLLVLMCDLATSKVKDKEI